MGLCQTFFNRSTFTTNFNTGFLITVKTLIQDLSLTELKQKLTLP